MKKFLLTLFALPSLAFGQVFLTENFNNFNVANLSNDITGATAGQNNWFMTATNTPPNTTSTNASVASAAIVNHNATLGNVLQITGPNGSSGNVTAWKGGINSLWATRTAGNNVLQCEFDFFTGPATTSLNTMRLVFFDATNTRILAGLIVNMNTKSVRALAYYSGSSGVGNYNFTFGTGGADVILPTNSWVRMGFSYNKMTGECIFRGPGFNANAIGAAANTDPDRALIIGASGTVTSPTTINNTTSTIGLFDNIVVRAQSASDILATTEIDTPMIQKSVVYPNPASQDFQINIAKNFNANTTKLELFDVSGKKVKTYQASEKYDISDLPKGTYLLKLNDGNVSETTKIIKK